MIREEKQRQLEAVRAEMKAYGERMDALRVDENILYAWLQGYDTANSPASELLPQEVPVLTPEEMAEVPETPEMATVEHAILVLLKGRHDVRLQEIRQAFAWTHFETDDAIARLFAIGKITLGKDGYRLRLPSDKSFVGSADESPGLSNGGGPSSPAAFPP